MHITPQDRDKLLRLLDEIDEPCTCELGFVCARCTAEDDARRILEALQGEEAEGQKRNPAQEVARQIAAEIRETGYHIEAPDPQRAA
jgi:hypothetical protein